LIVRAEAQVETDRASDYLTSLCEQFDERAKAKTNGKVGVEWSETAGLIEFGWGRCALNAGPKTLTLRAEADDGACLRAIQELCGRHLEHAGEAEQITLNWESDGGAVAKDIDPDPHAARDQMREFHRRMMRH
jgi:hypothetical protein